MGYKIKFRWPVIVGWFCVIEFINPHPMPEREIYIKDAKHLCGEPGNQLCFNFNSSRSLYLWFVLEPNFWRLWKNRSRQWVLINCWGVDVQTRPSILSMFSAFKLSLTARAPLKRRIVQDFVRSSQRSLAAWLNPRPSTRPSYLFLDFSFWLFPRRSLIIITITLLNCIICLTIIDD